MEGFRQRFGSKSGGSGKPGSNKPPITNLASGLYGVSADDITLTITSGSLIVTATIHAPSIAAHAPIGRPA